jgi:very-short-patch-repair endonuclease
VGVMRPNRTDMRGGSGIKKQARTLRRNMTDAERALWKEFRKYGLEWRFRRQFPIPPYIVDFACIEARLIVKADGGQHAAPGGHDIRDSDLQRQGRRVLRFWNNEILANRAGVLQVIVNLLGPPPGQSPHPTPPPLAGEGVCSEPAAVARNIANGFETDDVAAAGKAVSSSAQATEACLLFPPPQAGEG